MRRERLAGAVKIKALAHRHGREVKTIINPHVICRATEKEAHAQYRAIMEHQDPVAADNFDATFMGGDQQSWKAAEFFGAHALPLRKQAGLRAG